MMAIFRLFLAACLLLAEQAAASRDPIAKVTDLLKDMLEKAKEDGEKDREVFAKFRCYCDTNIEEKTKSMEELTKTIKQLQAESAELRADTGKRSAENGELAAMISDNEQARTTAQSLRDKENEAFKDEELDLENAIGCMDSAIDTLSKVGADGTAAKASMLSSNQTIGVYEATEKADPEGLPSDLMVPKTFMSKQDASSAAHQSLVRLRSNVKSALKAASMLLSAPQRKVLTSFIQTDAPFTGEYQAQSGEVVGILKTMQDTFTANLATATQNEKAAAERFEPFMKEKTDNFDKMKEAFEKNEEVMGTNDETLATKESSIADAEANLAEDDAFLSKLKPPCEEKPKEYEKRKMIRANEEAAIGQVIAILNSETAGDVFGKVDSTTKGGTGASFLQVVHRHRHGRVSIRRRVQQQLQHAAKRYKSLKLARIAVDLENDNPFERVTADIHAMIEVIEKEEKADDDQKSWCDSERDEAHQTKEKKTEDIAALKQKIDDLDDTVNNEGSGLKKQLKEQNKDLKLNRKDQRARIDDRSEENAVYQKVVANIVEAEKVLEKATGVLKKYYEWLHAAQAPHHYEKKEGKDSGGHNIKRYPETSIEELEKLCSDEPSCRGFNTNGWLKSEIDSEEKWYDTDESLYVKVYDKENSVALVNKGGAKAGKMASKGKLKEDPDLPDTWEEDDDSEASGQKDAATDVVGMLKYILDQTIEEEHEEHMTEEANQHAFEEELADLKKQEQSILDTIADLEAEITEKEANIESTHKEREATELEKKNTERYIEEIKPGCDFIDENIETRKENRAAEMKSLNGALDAMAETPAYKEAEAEAERERLGKCADVCLGDGEATIKCKACIQGTSEAAYCALHPDTSGCDAV